MRRRHEDDRGGGMRTIEEWAGDVGPGWRDLVIETDRKLQEIIPGYTIAQVKEKFGGLRYYYDAPRGTSQENWQASMRIVNEAEAESFSICEMCGEPGTQRSGGWIKTLCDKDAEARTRGAL